MNIVGGGLAGCEAAWQCLQMGLEVRLFEMRPVKQTAAHQSSELAELVCSNSLKSMSDGTAPAQFKKEMLALNSLIVQAAMDTRVPAGQALAVDRSAFSQLILKQLSGFEQFELCRQEVDQGMIQASMGNEAWILATGPLSSPAICEFLHDRSGGLDRLFFYDAIAPVIDADSIDQSQVYRASRYGKGSDDYLNIPLSKSQYEAFIAAVKTAEMMPLHAFEETSYFESCLPIEVMIERGDDTLRFGPLKPVGLEDPKTGKIPHAVIQLRMENRDATMYSMVGFQTKMKWPEQKRIFSTLPGLESAEFLRLGSVHRNTYVQSPKILNQDFSMKAAPLVWLAGQITGIEGYTESAGIGLLVGRLVAARLNSQSFELPPAETFLGALARYVTEGPLGDFQPMNVNFGLLPKLTQRAGKAERKRLHCQRAQQAFDTYLSRIT